MQTALQRSSTRSPTNNQSLLIAGLGVTIIGLSVSQLILDPEPLAIQFIEVGTPTVLSLPIFYTVKRFSRTEYAKDEYQDVISISALFIVLVTGTIFLALWSVRAGGTRVNELLFPGILGLSVGGSAGSIAGLLYAELQTTETRLSAEIDRTNELNQRLSVLNRILRHNVRNSLTIAFSSLETIKQNVQDTDLLQETRTCESHLRDLHSQAEKALYIERLSDPDLTPEPTDLVSLIQETVEAWESGDAVEIRTNLPDEAKGVAHPLTDIAIDEGIENAVTHNSREGLVVEIDVSVDDEYVTVGIHDNGSGMQAIEAEALTLDEETPLTHGSGVGLWLIKWLTEAANGDIELHENETGGLSVVLQYPALEDSE